MPLITVQANFGGPNTLRQKLRNTNPVCLWPMGDTFGESVTDVLGYALHGEASNISRGDPGMLPEFGCASTFTQTSARGFGVPVPSHLAQAWTHFAFAFLFTGYNAHVDAFDSRVFSRDAGTTGGRIRVGFKRGSPGKLYFGLETGGAYTEIEYTIPSTADWAATPRMILAVYSGATMRLIQVSTVTGAVTTLASAAKTGSITGIPNSWYVGSHANTTEFLTGRLQHCCLWINAYPTDLQIADFGTSLFWTDIGADVLRSRGFEWTWGSKTGARVAEVGTLQFTLRNSKKNSAKTVGYYTPGHASCRAGFGEGMPVRVILTNPSGGAERVKFRGKLLTAVPQNGWNGAGGTACTAVDYMHQLGIAKMPSLPLGGGDLVAGARPDEALGKILQRLPVTPHQVLSAGTYSEIFPYGGDRARDEQDSPTREIKAIFDSEVGQVYLREGGILTQEARTKRVLETAPDWSFSNEVLIDTAAPDRISRVAVTAYPRVLDTTATHTLYSLLAPFKVGPLQTVTVRANYTDDGETEARIGGANIVTPLVAGTHFTATADEAGVGTVLSASVAITFAGDPGSNSSTLLVTNYHASSEVWIQTITLKGKRVLTWDPVEQEAVDAELQLSLGDKPLRLDQPYQSKPESAKTVAQLLLGTGSIDLVAVRAMRFTAGETFNATRRDFAVRADIGDLVELTDSTLGLDDDQFYIAGLTLKPISLREIEVTAYLVRREIEGWLLGEPGRGELGLTTRWG